MDATEAYATVHFRAPDGDIYEIVFEPDHVTRGRTPAADAAPSAGGTAQDA